MATLYGARVFQENSKDSNIRYDVIGDNSEVLAIGDPVYINSTNELDIYTGTVAILGVAVKSQTLASDNETVAKVRPGFIPAADTIFLMGTNSDLTNNATDVGKFYKLTGATGAVQVDVSAGVTTGNARIVQIVRVDPREVGGTGAGSGLREVLVRFVKVQTRPNTFNTNFD